MNDQEATTSGEDTRQPAEPKPKKRIGGRAKAVILAVVVVAAVAGIAWFLRYQASGQYQQSTDDAYIQADSVTVSSKVSGHVDSVDVVDNQEVVAGQLLARIDPKDYAAQKAQYRAQIDAALAAVDAARANFEEQQATIARAEAQLASSAADAEFASAEFERYAPMAMSGAETREKVAQLQNQATQAKNTAAGQRANVAAARKRLDSLRAAIRQAEAQGETARAQFAAAETNLAATEIRASTNGRIGDKQVRVGQFVSVGTRLMTVVPKVVYITANFKETQIGIMRAGQPATIEVDALPGQVFEGKVEGISPGTGAQFSVLPPQNATGNFTKIVQRVPVKIAVSASPQIQALLVPGLSSRVRVDTISAKNDLMRRREEDARNRS